MIRQKGFTELPRSETENTIQELRRITNRNRYTFLGLTVFIVLISSYIVLNSFSPPEASKQMYREMLLSYELMPFWGEVAKEEEKKQREGQKKGVSDVKIIEEGEHTISRAELGRIGWTLLHMISGGFPDELSDDLVEKFNVFLILFGQFYPCKLCANHFLKLLEETGPFGGHSKIEMMRYLCGLHNRVNQKLQKPIHSCEAIKKEWNTCGCADS